MNYVNTETAKLNSAPMNGATHEQLGVWVRLLAYCAAQENGGKIEGARDWTARQWITSTAVEMECVKAESPLWHFGARGVLVIVNYPLDQQNACQKQRESVRNANRKRWKDYRRQKSSNDSSNESSESSGKERKGKETLHLTTRNGVIADRSEAVEYASGAKPKSARKQKT